MQSKISHSIYDCRDSCNIYQICVWTSLIILYIITVIYGQYKVDRCAKSRSKYTDLWAHLNLYHRSDTGTTPLQRTGGIVRIRRPMYFVWKYLIKYTQ